MKYAEEIFGYGNFLDACEHEKQLKEHLAACYARIEELVKSKQHEFECFQRVNSALTDAKLEITRLKEDFADLQKQALPLIGRNARLEAALREIIRVAHKGYGTLAECEIAGLAEDLFTTDARTEPEVSE